jgi:hypothetical protein
MTTFSKAVEFHGISAADGRDRTERYMCTVRNPIHPKQFHEIWNSSCNSVAGEEVVVFWKGGGIDFSRSRDLLELCVDDVELVFSDMFRAVGHAEVQPGVASIWHLLELFSDNGFWDGAVADEVFGSGEAFDGDGLDAVAELGYVF